MHLLHNPVSSLLLVTTRMHDTRVILSTQEKWERWGGQEMGAMLPIGTWQEKMSPSRASLIGSLAGNGRGTHGLRTGARTVLQAAWDSETLGPGLGLPVVPCTALAATAGSPWKLCCGPARQPCGLEALELPLCLSPPRLATQLACSFLPRRGEQTTAPCLSTAQDSPWAGHMGLPWSTQLHRLSQSPGGLRNHRATGPRAPGSAVSEVTGGTPVLCK
ncbi:hypothetical protein H1C71_032718 [Ictidomys tridecemlineatus]|nr:hypothetical protein H1C71_032718 [Ictidomys tridecemlineatus]